MLRKIRAQAAVDFMLSYGIALIIIFIAMAVIYKVSIVSPVISVPNCFATPGFGCEAFSLNRSGVLTLALSQVTGGSVVIRGAACASQANTVNSVPAYGNVRVTNTVNSLTQPLLPFYTVGNTPVNGIPVYSGSSNTLYLYCYSAIGVAKGTLGSSYTGFVWLNYTIPNYGNLTQQVVSLSLKYT